MPKRPAGSKAETESSSIDLPARPYPLTVINTVVLCGMVLALLSAFSLEISLGSVFIPPKAILSMMLGKGNVPEEWRHIVFLFRLPRALTAMLAGAALGIAGLKMQTLFRNPLADPFVLGISAGASLGAAIVVMLAGGPRWNLFLERTCLAGNISLTLGAVLGAAAVLVVVLSISYRVEGNLTLLIIGIMFGYITSSVVQILMQFTIEHGMQAYLIWTFGSFGGITWRQLRVFAPTVMCGLSISWILVKPLNAMLLGNEYARSMGVNLKLVRFWIIGGASLLAGAVTAFCGPVGFLGIAIPHLGRILVKTSDHRQLVPSVMILGGTVALLADLASQVPGTEIALPLNAVTALIGAPVVVGVILRRRHIMEAGL